MKDKSIVRFKYGDSVVRTVKLEGGGHGFVAADVAEVLGIRNVAQMVKDLDEDEKGICKTSTPGGDQEMLMISESGFYTVLIRSNKPQARKFRRWVTHEVLPQIRRTGKYKPKRASSLTGTKLRLSGGEIIEYKANMGRPPGPIPERFEELLRGGCSAAYAAEVMGVNPIQAYTWLRRMTVE